MCCFLRHCENEALHLQAAQQNKQETRKEWNLVETRNAAEAEPKADRNNKLEQHRTVPVVFGHWYTAYLTPVLPVVFGLWYLTPRVLCFKLATDTAAASSLDAAWLDSEVAIKSTTAAAVKLEAGNQAQTRKKKQCREKRKKNSEQGTQRMREKIERAPEGTRERGGGGGVRRERERDGSGANYARTDDSRLLQFFQSAPLSLRHVRLWLASDGFF